jgi:hypothetical protein
MAETITGMWGANGYAAGQRAPGLVAEEVVPARDHRRSVHLKNMDATSIVIYIGAGATMSAVAGSFPLAPGQTVELPTTAAIWAMAASGTPSLAYVEVYD